MIDVLDTTKQLYMESSHKDIKIVFPNKNITLTNSNVTQESIELTEMIETEKQLSFKGCNSSTFSFSMAGLLQDVRDEYVEVSIQAGSSEEIPLFHGYVVSQTNRTFEDVVTKIECQDILYKIRNLDVTAWYNGLTFPITVKNFRDSFFTYLGIDQVVDVYTEDDTGALINDTLTLAKMDPAKLPKVLNAGDVMQYICQINARYGQIGRDEKFHYRQLREIIKGLYPSYETFPSPTTYPSGENADAKYDIPHYSKVQYEPYMVESIDGVTIRDNEGSATKYYTVTSPTNIFEIADNFLASSLTDKSTAAQNIYNEIKVVWYIPMNLDCLGFPWMECGDIILTRTKKNMVRTYILKHTLKGLQSLKDSIESKGEQYREEYKESESTGISTNRSGVKANADEIIRTNEIVATKATIQDLNAQTARINTLYGTTIIADAVNYGTLDGQYITANSIKTSHLTAGCITSGKIAAGAITASKISADAFSGSEFQGATFRIGTAYILSGLYVGGNLWKAEWKQFDQVPSGAYVLYHS